MILLGFVLCLTGFTLLALAMDRHLKQLFPGVSVQAGIGLWRGVGLILLCSSFVPTVLHYGLSIGITAWFGMATFAAVMIGLALSYFPQMLRFLLSGIVRRN